MHVTYFYRKPVPNHHFSMERLFNPLRDYLANRVAIDVQVLPHYCDGKGNKGRNIAWAREHSTAINHIAGDVHYAGIGLPKQQKLIITVHDVNFLRRRNIFRVLESYVVSLLLPLYRAQVVTVVSERTRRELTRLVPFFKHKIRVIPNFYYPSHRPFPKEFNAERPVLLQVGTNPNKNVRRLLEAIAPLPCRLCIIGRPEPEIERLLQVKNIDYTWESSLSDEQVLQRYQQCDMLCYVSTVEGFGMPILEAQAVGRVVLTSTTSSMPEVANGSALLVNPYSVPEIRAGIERLIADKGLREDLIAKGFTNVKRYELATVADMYYELYAELAAGLPQPA